MPYYKERSGPCAALRQYSTLFRIRFIGGLQYRAAALAGLSTQFVWGGMTILLFRAFYRSDPSSFPMDFQGLSSYIWMQQAFLALFMLWSMENEPFELIRSGNVAYELCRPVDLYWMWFVRTAATRVSKAVLRCVPILLLAAFLPEPYGVRLPDAGIFLLFLLSMGLALLSVAAFSMLVYISTFYTLDSSGLRMLAASLTEFLSGAIIPLPFFPEPVERVLSLLPFAGMESTPLQIFAGTLAGKDALTAILLQLFWAMVMIIGGKLWMQRALSQVVAQGG